MHYSGLDRLFAPRSIAIVGASQTLGKPGNNVLRHLTELGYMGDVWPVNPGGGTHAGRDFFRAMDELPSAPDVIYLVVPAARAVEALRDCATKGAGAVIVGASGFSELDSAEGRTREAELTAIARAAGMRLIGPNTNGLVSSPESLALGFNMSFPLGARHPGPVSIISHSGALFDAAVLPLHRAGTGIARFLAVGNEADVTLVEAMEWLAMDPETHVIGLVIEALSDPLRFRQAAIRAAAAGKSVVAIKVGRSAAGASAALAHSSRIAGSARAYNALFCDAGVAAAPTVEAFAAALILHARFPEWDGRPAPLVCVTSSGGGGALVVDAAATADVPLAVGPDGIWPEPAQSALAPHSPTAPVRHPIDLGTLGNWAPLGPMIQALAPLAPGPLIAFAHTSPTDEMAQNLRAALDLRRRTVSAPAAVLSPGGLPDAAAYRSAGIPLFTDTASLIAAFAAIHATDRQPMLPSPAAPGDPDRQAEVAAALANARHTGTTILREVESAAILARFGVPFAQATLADDPDSAAQAATAMGFPIALKGQAPNLAHKAEAGMVRLALTTAAEVAAAAHDMAARTPDTGLQFLVQAMHRPAVEGILAVTLDPQLGPFLLFGPGGAGVETSGQTVMVSCPAQTPDLERRITQSPLGTVLTARLGPRAPAAITRLADTLASLGTFAQEQGGAIRAAEVNPMIVADDGTCTGVDALIELSEETS